MIPLNLSVNLNPRHSFDRRQCLWPYRLVALMVRGRKDYRANAEIEWNFLVVECTLCQFSRLWEFRDQTYKADNKREYLMVIHCSLLNVVGSGEDEIVESLSYIRDTDPDSVYDQNPGLRRNP